MKLTDLLDHYTHRLSKERETALTEGLDTPIETSSARHVATTGTLHLYAFGIQTDRALPEDVPVTILPSGNAREDLEPTEGYIICSRAGEILIQTLDSLGQTLGAYTIIPDTAGFFETASKRLAEMAAKPESFSLGPADRLVPWLDPDQAGDASHARTTASASVLTTIWGEDKAERQTKLGTLIVELMRKNKRVLLMSRDHQSIDQLTGFMAHAMRMAALPFKSLLSRYEMPAIPSDTSGVALQEFGFEAQMHQFFSKARANKTALRQKYDRFRELTPILAYKGQKQRDLNEVKLLEWRLLNQFSDCQGRIKDIERTVAEYESLPIWKRLAMQTAGKNVATLGEYRQLYQEQVQELLKEIEVAQQRIAELKPEAAIPKDMRPEYEELKEEITRLGGTKKIRELLAAGEGTNRQAFIQNKRLVAITPARVVTDPLFRRVRFDVLVVDEAPRIPAPFLLGAAGVIGERIVLSGDTQDLSRADENGPTSGVGIWRQHCLPESFDPAQRPSPVV